MDSANGPDSTNVSIEGAVQETSPETSYSDSESSDPIDPDLYVTLTPQVGVPVDDENDDSKKTLGRNENREASENWETVYDLASDVTRAAKNALFSRRKTYKKVVAVITYWETATGLEHLRKKADKLGRLFKDSFKFDVLVYRIPENVSNRKFVSTIGDELDKVAEDPDSLFILYYGGHASMGDFNNLRLWKKEYHHLSANIEWSSAQRTLFANKAVCNKLFLFDCCHAGAMIDPSLKWQTSCELLGACAADVEASALGSSSFTKAFRKEISNNIYAIWELHSALCSTENRIKYNLKMYPFYQDCIGHQRETASVVLEEVGPADESQDPPQKPSDKLAHLDKITEAVICVAITFNCSAEAFVKDIEAIQKDWTRWFKFPPTEADEIIVRACEGPKVLAAFNSNSCITIWSFPIWLWDVMAPLSGFQHIGFIRPQNFALAASGIQTGLAELIFTPQG